MEAKNIEEMNIILDRIGEMVEELRKKGEGIEAVKKNCDRVKASLRIIRLNIPIIKNRVNI